MAVIREATKALKIKPGQQRKVGESLETSALDSDHPTWHLAQHALVAFWTPIVHNFRVEMHHSMDFAPSERRLGPNQGLCVVTCCQGSAQCGAKHRNPSDAQFCTSG